MEKNWLRKLIGYTSLLLIIAAVIMIWDLYRLLKLPMLRKGQSAVLIHLQEQTSARQFVKLLKEKKLIRSGRLFRLMIRFQDQSEHLKAGIYKVYPGESAEQFLYRVVDGDVLTQTFRINEGTTLFELSKRLEKAPYLTYRPSDWARIAGRHASAEGLLLADTYRYHAGSDSYTLLSQAKKELMDYLQYTWQHRDENLPYKTSYELLIAASILEKEASIPQERKLIAGVMINRLKKSMPLQMDPTVIYALGRDYQGKLSREDLRVDSTFNTYRYRGLPPTPIAMVGKISINAAAHPEPSNYLYFVAKGDGSHQFSETYQQQKEAILRYQMNENGE